MFSFFSFESLKAEIESLTGAVHIIICTGGVSMGDKDFVKPVLKALNYELIFGRVNMKPGKPCAYATSKVTKFFGLPGNPVSAFVTFHLFALPALRQYLATLNETAPNAAKASLPMITVEVSQSRRGAILSQLNVVSILPNFSSWMQNMCSIHDRSMRGHRSYHETVNFWQA